LAAAEGVEDRDNDTSRARAADDAQSISMGDIGLPTTEADLLDVGARHPMLCDVFLVPGIPFDLADLDLHRRIVPPDRGRSSDYVATHEELVLPRGTMKTDARGLRMEIVA